MIATFQAEKWAYFCPCSQNTRNLNTKWESRRKGNFTSGCCWTRCSHACIACLSYIPFLHLCLLIFCRTDGPLSQEFSSKVREGEFLHGEGLGKCGHLHVIWYWRPQLGWSPWTKRLSHTFIKNEEKGNKETEKD